jgi:hypothetical protein
MPVGDDAVGAVGDEIEVSTVTPELAGDPVEAGHVVDPLDGGGAGGLGVGGLD